MNYVQTRKCEKLVTTVRMEVFVSLQCKFSVVSILNLSLSGETLYYFPSKEYNLLCYKSLIKNWLITKPYFAEIIILVKIYKNNYLILILKFILNCD